MLGKLLVACTFVASATRGMLLRVVGPLKLLLTFCDGRLPLFSSSGISPDCLASLLEELTPWATEMLSLATCATAIAALLAAEFLHGEAAVEYQLPVRACSFPVVAAVLSWFPLFVLSVSSLLDPVGGDISLSAGSIFVFFLAGDMVLYWTKSSAVAQKRYASRQYVRQQK